MSPGTVCESGMYRKSAGIMAYGFDKTVQEVHR